MELKGTLNWRLQKVQTPIAGTVPTHLTTLRLRFGMFSLSVSGLDGLHVSLYGWIDDLVFFRNTGRRQRGRRTGVGKML